MSEISCWTINHAPGKGELTVLFSGHSQTLSGHAIGPTVHDYLLIHTILSGKGIFTSRDTTYELSQGDSFFINAAGYASLTLAAMHMQTYIAVRATRKRQMVHTRSP